MKKIIVALSLLFIAFPCYSQELFGVPAKKAEENDIQIIPKASSIKVDDEEELKVETTVRELSLPSNAAPSTAPENVSIPVKYFRVLTSDQTVRGVINRWLKDEGYQDVIWKLNEDILIEREVQLSATNLPDALGELMSATGDSEPARACIHSNKVVRVIPRTLFCE